MIVCEADSIGGRSIVVEVLPEVVDMLPEGAEGSDSRKSLPGMVMRIGSGATLCTGVKVAKVVSFAKIVMAQRSSSLVVKAGM